MSDKLVIGGSGGIGAALMQQLKRDYPNARVLGTSTTVQSELIPLDFTRAQSTEKFIKELDSIRFNPDQIILASGALHSGSKGPERSLKELDQDWLSQLMQINAIAPVLLLAKLVEKLDRKAKVQIGVLSARVGSISDNRLGGWYGYRASKAALNMYLKTMAIELKRTHPQVQLLLLHPGTTDTKLSRPFQARVPADKLFTPEYAAGALLKVMEEVKGGESGQFLAWDGTSIPW